MENNVQNVAAEAAQNAAMQQVMNPANGAEVQTDVPASVPNEAPAMELPKRKKQQRGAEPKSLLEIAQMPTDKESGGFYYQSAKFGKILRDMDLKSLEKKVVDRIADYQTYLTNLNALLVEIRQKLAVERADEIKAILAALTPEQKAALLA